MSQLWQLKKLSTNEAVNEPQKLPENWGPIFGLSGFIDRIGELSWLGKEYDDLGWVVVGQAPEDPLLETESDKVLKLARELLSQSDWAVLPDVPMSSGNKALWIEYRKALREIRLQAGFPSNIVWPSKPS